MIPELSIHTVSPPTPEQALENHIENLQREIEKNNIMIPTLPEEQTLECRIENILYMIKNNLDPNKEIGLNGKKWAFKDLEREVKYQTFVGQKFVSFWDSLKTTSKVRFYNMYGAPFRDDFQLCTI